MATYTIRNNTTQDWRDTAMSKAQFEALATERRANRAGSGFDEFGKHTSGHPNVNEGMIAPVPAAGSENMLYIGQGTTAPIGTSKTPFALANINGVVHRLSRQPTPLYEDLKITLPPAPTVLPYDAVLTQQQIDSGVIKHADASNSGLIVNGKFTTDTSGWTGFGTSLSLASGKLRVANSGGSNGSAYQSFPTVVGKKYIAESTGTIGTSTLYMNARADTINGAELSYTISANSSYLRLEFTATTTTTVIAVRSIGADGTYSDYDNIAVFPADAISRSDLVFLESWHEDISEKDFVYPLGNVQYLGATGDCGTTAAGTFAGSATYSLFSDTWQADGALVGKGYVWSTLSDANKKAFVANPENNCYLDGDKVIQVRYRARVVQGLGDSWANVSTQTLASAPTYGALTYIDTTKGCVSPKGKYTSIVEYGSYASTGCFASSFDTAVLDNNTGQWRATGINSQNTFLGAYETKCYALPIALVHRRNQGAYHPVYNANGTKKASDGNSWYNTAVSFTSIADTMTDSKLTTTTGYIGTSTSRPDGLFYDQVHESDILDLRMSSQKVEDYNRLIDREFNKLVAGTYRGTEGEWNISSAHKTYYTFTKTGDAYWSTVNAKMQVPSTNITDFTITNIRKGDSGTYYYLLGSNGNVLLLDNTIQDNRIIGQNTYDQLIIYKDISSVFNTTFPNSTVISIIGITASTSTRTKSNTLTHTDIIGSPANYPTAWKQSGVSGVPLIVAEDGTSMLPTGSLTTFKLSRKANATPLQVLKSTDSGVTWTILTVTTHYTFSTTTNAITFVTAPATTDLIMVTYQTHTNMAVPAVNSEALAIGDALVNAYSGFSASIYSLIGKVGTIDFANNGMGSSKLISVGVGTTLNTGANVKPSHSPLAPAITTSPAVKVFPYLTRSNGKAYLQLVFKEMKHNGTSWGDDSKFNIVDNVSTTTDNNAQVVLIGQKRCELPYFISAGE